MGSKVKLSGLTGFSFKQTGSEGSDSVLVLFNLIYDLSKNNLPPSVLTGVVPAAAGGASSSPATLKCHGGPEAGGVLTQSVWCQIADLQT